MCVKKIAFVFPYVPLGFYFIIIIFSVVVVVVQPSIMIFIRQLERRRQKDDEFGSVFQKSPCSINAKRGS